MQCVHANAGKHGTGIHLWNLEFEQKIALCDIMVCHTEPNNLTCLNKSVPPTLTVRIFPSNRQKIVKNPQKYTKYDEEPLNYFPGPHELTRVFVNVQDTIITYYMVVITFIH